ncbi:alpha/beta hydrolase [Pseudonocardia abyssalis]|uniref:Alpha/beta fold hydrolase n=1 Tax=Pseudonocardia abyssalis TaxID=2792008 RepID=A0ABS6ULP1_9PSEU|nr:alpha/beta hydrolase [Pseudonocardia abyssalis]MBW0115080.1 alpha/beta fold hydrolase [Pseudonocardia abyssalis]MBW0133175.1 alpha/beta fold hydrolase [Pseudonocardia abyssalis]
MTRPIRWAAAAMVVAVGLAAVIVGARSVDQADRFGGQQLAWGSCAAFTAAAVDVRPPAGPDAQCAYLRVPLDHAAPDGPEARIGVLRVPASDPGSRIGSLVLNPGGPGLPGIAAAADLAVAAPASELARRFDIVGFDPRGIGSSRPAVRCQPDRVRDAERAADRAADTSPAGVARFEAQQRADNAACVASTGTDVLAHIGSRDVARDLDILRSALGDEKLTYLGDSYGTRLGTAYAEQFPDRVRAMILDGAIDPGQSAADRAVAQAAQIQAGFDAYAADCAPRPGCPVGRDPVLAVPVFQALLRPLLDHPLPTADSRALTFGDAATGVGDAVVDPARWPDLTDGLREIASGTGDLLMQQADVVAGRAPDGTYDPDVDAGQAVLCVDDPPTTDPAAARALDARIRAAAPILDNGRGPSPARDRCGLWPVPPTGGPHRPVVPGLPRVLVVSTVGDPITPYPAGVALAGALDARLLTYEGAQHTVSLQGVDCVDRIGTAYLISLGLPADGIACPA